MGQTLSEPVVEKVRIMAARIPGYMPSPTHVSIGGREDLRGSHLRTVVASDSAYSMV